MQYSTMTSHNGSDQRHSRFAAHPIGEIIRGLVFSSVLWGLLAVGVYTVYAMVLGTR